MGGSHRKSRMVLWGGCFVCHGEYAQHWQGDNARASASRHARKTGHRTYAQEEVVTYFNDRKGADHGR